jgi:1-acyl-sn-glycerol-3-phosphate acyltransferase
MSEQPYQVPGRVRAARPIVKTGVRLIALAITRVTVIGRENVPLGKPYLVAQNHISLYDPPYAIAFWPEMLEVIGAVDIWQKPGQNLLAKWWGMITVHRGEYDRALIETILQVLRSGRPLLIAPEGGRSHVTALRRAKPGIGFLIDAAQVPVVPVGLTGTTDDLLKRGFRGKRPHVIIRIGEPLSLPPIEAQGTERREARQRYADLVMARIADLLPPSYRGVYAEAPLGPAGAGSGLMA